jgi:hypothetical protein
MSYTELDIASMKLDIKSQMDMALDDDVPDMMETVFQNLVRDYPELSDDDAMKLVEDWHTY